VAAGFDKPPEEARRGVSIEEAKLVFERLVPALATGRDDPETLFSAHPALEPDLWALYRGWQRVESLLRLVEGESLGSVLVDLGAELESASSAAAQARALERIQRSSGFAQRYELGPELGRGGMGIVRRAVDRLLGREVALKAVRERGGDAQRLRLLQRFLAEAEVTGRLQHPSIPAIHDLGLDDQGRVYFTMPLVEGTTLQQVLARARSGDPAWPLARVLEVLIKVGDALAYAHSRGVLHRDLKPSNVLVGRFGEAYVLDWGLARALDGPAIGTEADPPQAGGQDDEPRALTLFGEVVGTPAYMAPEQAAGLPPGERSDVYSLGAVLYEAMSGQRPYSTPGSEPDARETLRRIALGPPPSIEALAPRAPRALRAIARKAMSRAQAERYASVADMGADLRAFLGGRVVTAHESGAWAEARRWVARNRALALALGLCVALVSIGGMTTAILHAKKQRAERDVARFSLMIGLSRERRPEQAVDSRLLNTPPEPDHQSEVGGRPEGATSADELENLKAVMTEFPESSSVFATAGESIRRYREQLAAVGVGNLGIDIEALYRDASPVERLELLDELYWFELRLVVAQAEVANGRTLEEVERLVHAWETRGWQLVARSAWTRRRAGDAGAFEDLVQEDSLRAASAIQLEWLAVLLASAGEFESARTVLARAHAADAGRFWVHFQLALSTSGRERLQHSYAATVLDPTSALAHYNYGWNFQNISEPPFGEPDVATSAYRRALALDPGFWEAALNLTYLVPPEEAIQLMERSNERTPRAIAYLRLAERFREIGKPEQGIDACRQGLARFPDDSSLWGMLGEWMCWTNSWKEAVDALERAIALGAADPASLNNLCVALSGLSVASTSDPARASELDRRNLEVAERASALFPGRPDIAEKLGIAHVNLGDYAAGARHLLTSLELGNERVREYLRTLRPELARAAAHAELVEEIDAALGE
jgi:tetratricopeptide (TPR) repeat protein